MSNGKDQHPLSLVLTLKDDKKPDDFPPLFSTGNGADDGPKILHFAWVVPLGERKYLLSTVYDGPFGPYLDAFIDANPNLFNLALMILEGAPPPPITDPVNRQAFHEFVARNDLTKMGTVDLFSAYPDMSVIQILRCEQE